MSGIWHLKKGLLHTKPWALTSQMPQETQTITSLTGSDEEETQEEETQEEEEEEEILVEEEAHHHTHPNPHPWQSMLEEVTNLSATLLPYSMGPEPKQRNSSSSGKSTPESMQAT